MPSDSPILFLDGGLGTSLQDKYGLQFSHKTTPLWSADAVVTAPQTLLACQRDFAAAPVDVIETATYQASIAGFAATRTAQWPGGVPRAHIPPFLRAAVAIAAQAGAAGAAARVALSLGPYGATMVPGQEYSGAYDAAHSSEAQLRAWWAERLALFAAGGGDSGGGGGAEVAFVACETLPRVDEIRAVRLAVAGLTATVPCWLSCVFPGEGDELPDGSSVEQVVEAALLPEAAKAQPWGIGINCTKVHKLEGLVAKLEVAVARLVGDGQLAAWPALVLYPDGTNGEVYNTTTQKWELPARQQKQPIPWEKHFGDVVLAASRRQKWNTILAGGCCKASPSDIKKLVDYVKHNGEPPPLVNSC